MTQQAIHGVKFVEGSHHPLLDLPIWEKIAPLGDKRKGFGCIETPTDLAIVAQARKLAAAGRPLLGVPVDMFVWALARPKQPYLTKLGGIPWMEKHSAWPRGNDGKPLTFLGQICFLDSLDLLPVIPPGEVVLFFGDWSQGSVWSDASVVWSSAKLTDPLQYDMDARDGVYLPFEYSGVRHRSYQFIRTNAIDPEETEATSKIFEAAGFPDGSFELADPQVTQIGTYAGLPQGWPFEPDDAKTLLCVLSSYQFSGAWPLCDVPEAPHRVRADGSPILPGSWNALSMQLGDGGCAYVYKTGAGQCVVESECT